MPEIANLFPTKQKCFYLTSRKIQLYNMRMIINKIKNTIKEHQLIEYGDYVILGLSGGPDSVCLFHALFTLREELGIELYAVHLNHQFREEAAIDQKYVENLCKEYGIPCHSFKEDVNNAAKTQGISGEEAGRNLRYQCYSKVAQQIRQKINPSASIKIAVAHNLNDQAETLLMRIIRGSGVDGLSGMEYSRKGLDNSMIIRPLLEISRDEIEKYCKNENLNPRIDHTNELPLYTRNKIRLNLIPYIQENYNPNVIEALNRLSKIAREDKHYIYEIVDSVIRNHAKIKLKGANEAIATIPLKILQEQHIAIRHRILMNLLGAIGLKQNITSGHLAAADSILLEGRTSSMTDFPEDYRIKITYGIVEIYKKKDFELKSLYVLIDLKSLPQNIQVSQYEELTAKLIRKNSATTTKSTIDYCHELLGDDWEKNRFVALDYDEIALRRKTPVLRNRLQGDWIRPKGMSGKKKIQNFFVDCKIPREERDDVPLLCLGTEVVWVVGQRISENYKINDETENILLLEYKNKL